MLSRASNILQQGVPNCTLQHPAAFFVFWETSIIVVLKQLLTQKSHIFSRNAIFSRGVKSLGVLEFGQVIGNPLRFLFFFTEIHGSPKPCLKPHRLGKRNHVTHGFFTVQKEMFLHICMVYHPEKKIDPPFAMGCQGDQLNAGIEEFCGVYI